MKKTIAQTTFLVLALMLTGCGAAENPPHENGGSTASSIISADSGSSAVQGSTPAENDPDGQYAPQVPGSSTSADTSTNETTQNEPIEEANKMKISINGRAYTAQFSDTAAAEEFKAMLPLTLEMSELNGNEKYVYLDSSFTTASEKVSSISKGDIMLYGSDCVVLFYDSFSTPYSYTRLGYIEAPDGLESAVGSGSVTVTFE